MDTLSLMNRVYGLANTAAAQRQPAATTQQQPTRQTPANSEGGGILSGSMNIPQIGPVIPTASSSGSGPGVTGTGTGAAGDVAPRPGLQPPTPQTIGAQQGYTPEQAANTGGYEARGYDAKSIGVSPNATVSGRLTQLIDENSKYIQQARQRAMQQMNSRGFLNSTMAAEAGTRAAIDAGLPLAQGDASAYNQRELAQMEQTNRAREFSAGAQNEAARWGSQLAAETERFNVGTRNQGAQWQSQLDAETARFNTETLNNMATQQWQTLSGDQQQEFMARLNSALTTDQATRVAQIQADAGRLATMDSTFGNLMAQHLQTVAAAASNSNWSAEQQQAMVNLSLDQFQKFLPYYNAFYAAYGSPTPGGAQ